MMRTTIDIDPRTLEDVEKLTGEKSPSKAVNKALSEYVRRRKLQELRDLLGTMDLEDNWREMEQLEMKELRPNNDGPD
jgi:Arc/MetJ family transcription regulator